MKQSRNFDANDHRPNNPPYGPAELIACIPGALGFYPQESLVLIGLSHAGEDATSYTVGPIVRADLASEEQIAFGLRALFDAHQDLHLAVIITRIPNSDLAMETAYFLQSLDTQLDLPPLAACWHVSEIAAGTPYTLLFDATSPQLFPAHHERTAAPASYFSGTVPSIVHAPTMRGLLDNGMLPELRREDMHLFFESDNSGDLRRCRALYDAAYHSGRRLIQQLAPHPAGAGEGCGDRWDAINLIEDGCVTLIHGGAGNPEFPAGTSRRPLQLSDCFRDDEEIVLLASLLSRSKLRDCLVEDVLEHSATAAQALLLIARNFTGVIRANALSLWALAAAASDLEPWAFAALRAAQDEVPGHSLSAVQRQLMAIGEWQGMVSTALAGCRESWDDLLREQAA